MLQPFATMPYRIVVGDLLDAQEEYILQQNNCIGCKPHGLSKTIADKYPYADPYTRRRRVGNRNMAIPEDRPVPGTIELFRSPNQDGPTFVSLYGQYGMGRPYAYNNGGPQAVPDSHEDREKWFVDCLQKVAELDPKSVAIPYKIGCGLAGGDWNRYSKILNRFADDHPSVSVVLYKLMV